MDKKKIIDNASWIIGCKLVKAVLTFLTARYLGASNYGLINYAASLVTFMTPVMKLGLDAILVHELINDADHQGEILGTSIVLNTLSALLCIIGVVTFSMQEKLRPILYVSCIAYYYYFKLLKWFSIGFRQNYCQNTQQAQC